MSNDAQVLREARVSSALTLEAAAALAGIEPQEYQALESGEQSPSPAILDTFAKAFGLTLTDLLLGRAAATPSSLLFRSFRERGPSLLSLASSGALTTLGDFVRCVRAVAEIRDILGVHRSTPSPLERLGQPTPPVADGLVARAEQHALAVRNKLGLGVEPIDSMIGLYKRLEIDLLFVTPDELDIDVDAASTVTPAPAVLVNLVGGAEGWWRTRATLAHELCHVIFDRALFGTESFVMMSPSAERAQSSERLVLPPTLELVEKRARAFALHFLVPRPELTRVLARRDPRSESAVTTVCQHFQVGRRAAVNQLRNVGLITDYDRRRMLANLPASSLPVDHPDARVGVIGLRGGLLKDRSLRALAEDKMSAIRARSYLEVPAADPLPPAPGLDPAKCAPLVTESERVEKSVVRRLAGAPTLADCYVDAISTDGEVWRVEVAQAGPNGLTAGIPRGFVLVGPDFQILEEHILPRREN